jgi:hypothetical protein
MSAFQEIAKHRRALERIDLASTMRLAVNGSRREVEKCMQRWARAAEIDLMFEEED